MDGGCGPPSRLSIWASAGLRPGMALDVRSRRSSGSARRQGGGAGAGDGAGDAFGGIGGFGGRRRRSAELDAATVAGRDRGANGPADLPVAAQRGDAQKGGFRWRRPRHTLKGRQDAIAVDRSGLHLLKQQARAGDIVLLFQDESEALTHPYLACLGQARRRPARRSARPSAQGGDDRRSQCCRRHPRRRD